MQNENGTQRFKALLVIAIFAVPIVASYLAYYVWQPKGGVTNYGELLKPVALPEDLALPGLDGKPVALKSLRGKWVLLQVDSGACDAACEKKLYALRQVRLIQGREQDRVLRLWIISDAAPPRDGLLNGRYDGTLVLRDSAGTLISKLPVKTDVRDHIYIVDPHGNAMMRYDRDPDLRRMSKDLEKLLKASWIG
jgi:hypothetical protein